MKFLITRTSIWDDEKKPYKSAKRETYTRVDQRGFKTAEEHDRKFPVDGSWMSSGRNHRVTELGIARDFDEQGWFIEVETLEELLQIKELAGHPLIIQNNTFNGEILEIEIYDRHRE